MEIEVREPEVQRIQINVSPGSGGVVVGQNNIDVVKTLLIDDADTPVQVLAKINGLQPYEVRDIDSIWFKCVAPGRTDKYKMINLGKGSYGVGATELGLDDLELVYSTGPQNSSYDFTLVFVAPVNSYYDFFKKATSVTAITALNVASLSYSVNNGASYTNVALPLAASINFNANTWVSWKVAFTANQAKAAVNITAQ